MQARIMLNWDSSLSTLPASEQTEKLLEYVARLIRCGYLEITGEPTEPLPLINQSDNTTFGTLAIIS